MVNPSYLSHNLGVSFSKTWKQVIPLKCNHQQGKGALSASHCGRQNPNFDNGQPADTSGLINLYKPIFCN